MDILDKTLINAYPPAENTIKMAWDGLTVNSYMNTYPPKRKFWQALAIVWFCSVYAAHTHASDDILHLNQRFADVSDAYYKDAAKNLSGTLYIKQDLKSLRDHLIKLRSSGDNALANAMLLANMPMVADKIGSRSTPLFLKQLLEHDIWSSAKRLADKALAEGSSLTTSRVNYLLGEYFFDRNDLDLTFKYLSAIESSDALTPMQRDYAALMFGIALQKIKKHRQALKVYERIEPGSYYYGYAQLNAAVGFIRQGWWTDAHVSIGNALKNTPPNALEEISNRLLLVLGYSQLQNEFYRNARETFRKISLDSSYVNRALLGIGLCALSQKDYAGAINAFTRLRNINSDQLPVLEAHLMLPYTYDIINNTDTAAEGYTEAIAFYEVKLRELELQSLEQRNTARSFSELDLKSQPSLIVQKYRTLQGFDKTQTSKAVQTKIVQLEDAFRKKISEGIAAATQEKTEHVKSYTSQAQYGLAKLYDNQ